MPVNQSITGPTQTDRPTHGSCGQFGVFISSRMHVLWERGRGKPEHLEETQREEQTRRVKSVQKKTGARIVRDFLLGGDITEPKRRFEYLQISKRECKERSNRSARQGRRLVINCLLQSADISILLLMISLG